MTARIGALVTQHTDLFSLSSERDEEEHLREEEGGNNRRYNTTAKEEKKDEDEKFERRFHLSLFVSRFN